MQDGWDAAANLSGRRNLAKNTRPPVAASAFERAHSVTLSPRSFVTGESVVFFNREHNGLNKHHICHREPNNNLNLYTIVHSGTLCHFLFR